MTLPIPLLATSYSINGQSTSSETFWLSVCAFMGLALLLRIVADRMDRSRIRDAVRDTGSDVVDITWTPFGPGWFGEKSDRIYEVSYRNRAGRMFTGTCKTSMFTGVYWHNDDHLFTRLPSVTACPKCTRDIPNPDKFCPHCGAKL